MIPILLFFDFPCGSAGKESPCNMGDLGSIPALGRSPREGKSYPLQYSGLRIPWTVQPHGVAKSQTRLSDFHSKSTLKQHQQLRSILLVQTLHSKQNVEEVTVFIFLDSKITADDDCSHEIKRHLLFGKKVMTNLDNILKQRHYFVNKGLSDQGYGFSSSHVWM